MAASARHHRRHHRHNHTDGREALNTVLELVDPDLLAAVEKVKATVSAALARVGDPVGEALDLIGPEEFIALVWRIPPPGRTDFLNDLKVPAARKPTVISAGLGLSRLRSWPPDRRRRTATFLTKAVANTIDDAWDGCDGSTVDERTEAVRNVLTAGRDNANIMRLTVLAQARNTPAMAVALRLALDNGLALPSWPDDAVDELRARCQDLQDIWLTVEATLAAAEHEKSTAEGQKQQSVAPGAMPVVHEAEIWDTDLTGGEPAENGTADPGVPADPAGVEGLAAGTRDVPGTATEDPSPDMATGSPGNLDFADVPAEGIDLEWATTTIAELRKLHVAARQAVTELADRIGRGHLPDKVRVMKLTALTDAAGTATGILDAAGYDVAGDTTVDELTAALREVAEAAGSAHRDRRAIMSLTALTGPPGSDEQIAEVRALATSLAITGTWDDEQQQRAGGLLALLDVIAAAAAGATQTATDAHTRAQRQLPAQLAGLTIAALLNQLAPGQTAPPAAAVDESLDGEGGSETPMATTPMLTDTDQDSAAGQGADGSSAALEESTGSRRADADQNASAALSGDADPALKVVAQSRSGDQEVRAGTVAQPVDVQDAGEPHSNGSEHDELAADENDSVAALTGGRGIHKDGVLDAAEHRDEQSQAADSGNGHRQLLRDLVARRRLSLAFHASAATGDRRRADALRILALADAARSETAPTAGALRVALEAEQRSSPAGDPATQLVLLAGSVRACLVTADPTAGESVLALARLMQQLPGIAVLATTIGTASRHGLLYSTAVLTALAPIAGADNDIAATVDAAVVERDRRRNLDFVRANQIVELWWSRTGLIGSLLDTVIHNRRAQVGAVLDSLRDLAKREDIAELLTRQDNEIRSTSSRPLQGQARRKLLEQARTSLDVVRSWVDAVLASPVGQARTPAPPALADLRQKVKAQWPAAEQELITLAAENSDALAGEAATLARDHLQRSVDMLDGAVLRGTDRDPDAVLYQDLLRAADLPFTIAGLPDRPVTVADITAAHATDWDAAFQARLDAEQFDTARQIITAVADPARVALMRVRLDDASAHTLADLRRMHRDVSAQVARAARLGQLGETASTAVNGRVEATTIVQSDDAAWQNLGSTRRQLQEILDSLPEHLHDAQDALRNRMIEEITVGGASTQQLVTAIEQRIDAGDLATAEEYLLAAAAGQAPPSEEPSTDLAVFTRLREQLPSGITTQVVDAVRAGRTVNGLDFSVLGVTERVAAADGLNAWLDLRAENHNNLMKSAVAYALRLAGIEFQQLLPVDLPSGSRRAWRDLANVVRTGDSRVPAFGSMNGDRLRIMLCWGDLDVRTLFSWVTQDPGSNPVLVLLFSAMTAAQRTALALACAQRQDKPVMVLDDIALAHLTLHGALQFSAMERILMPYAATNPYFPQANADVPAEMFFGRSDEITKINDPLGPNLIYGGRQLGKSALLQAAARRFELVRECVAVYVSLPNGVGVSVKPDVLWESISEKLAERGITPPRRTRYPVKNVTTAVTAWLAADASRRLLLLVDECDRFFDADAEIDFVHTTQLRNLMIDTKRRFKAVFAGLHQVQRFAHLPNQPLAGAHLGDQVAVGPLSPMPAYRLMFTPMETLGIRFASDELIHRVLAYCNYQPKLLQLVGEELVKSALNSRRTGPPYTFTDADLDQVLDSGTVRQRVRDIVHLTLNLDSRYKLIALVVALAACEHGADYTMSTSQLRSECQQWWPQGFAGQGADEFGSLLEEMRDLGVLAVADSQWRLRSSNVLRLLGSASSIEEELCSPEWRTTVTKLSVEQARRPVGGVQISPLTERQMSRLISRRVNVRVIAGTPATGVFRVRQLLEEARDAVGAQFDLAVPAAPAAYGKELRAGSPGGKHRVVLSVLPNPKIDTVLGALDRASRAHPQPGVTRTVVIAVDVTAGGVLASLGGAGAAIGEDLIMPLRRATATGLRSWLTDNERMSCFGDVTMHTALMTATGGWPVLLDLAAELALRIDRAQRICEEITASLATAEGAEEFLTATGLRSDARAQAAFEVLIEYADPVNTDDLVGLCAEAGPDPERTAAVLRMLDVLVQDESDGRWRPEPVTAAAWTTFPG
jgi:hypothetical protein